MSTLFAKEYQCFEDIKRTRPDGTEYWAARELAPVLDYAKWENFYKVIKRAMIACENSGRSVSDRPTLRSKPTGRRLQTALISWMRIAADL